MGSAVGRLSDPGNLFGGNPGSDPSRGFGPGEGPKFGKLFSPYKSAGKDALADLQEMLANGFHPGDLTQDPGYQFQLEQGNRAIEQGAGMQGSPFSGNTLQALSQFNQGLAGTTYQNAFNRWQTMVQNLAGIAGMGANAAGAQAQAEGGVYGSQAGVAGAGVARGGSFFGAASNILGF